MASVVARIELDFNELLARAAAMLAVNESLKELCRIDFEVARSDEGFFQVRRSDSGLYVMVELRKEQIEARIHRPDRIAARLVRKPDATFPLADPTCFDKLVGFIEAALTATATLDKEVAAPVLGLHNSSK